VHQALRQVCIPFVEGMVSDTLVGLFRIVVQMVEELPQLGDLIYHYGPLKGIAPLKAYLSHLHQKGELHVEHVDKAAGMLVDMARGRLHIERVLMPHRAINREAIADQVDYAIRVFIEAHQPR